jgi:hypothetical protein
VGKLEESQILEMSKAGNLAEKMKGEQHLK